MKSIINWLNRHRLLVLIPAAGIIILLLLPRLKSISASDIAGFVPKSIPLAALAFFALYVLKAAVMIIPVAVLYIAAGIVFPTGWAIAVTYFCLLAELSIGYLNGKRLGEIRVRELMAKNARAAAFFSTRKDKMPSLCFITRILPFPYEIVSMFCGAMGMPFPDYIIISLLALSPFLIPYILAGSSISTPLSSAFLVPFGISMSITLAVFLIYKGLTRRYETVPGDRDE